MQKTKRAFSHKTGKARHNTTGGTALSIAYLHKGTPVVMLPKVQFVTADFVVGKGHLGTVIQLSLSIVREQGFSETDKNSPLVRQCYTFVLLVCVPQMYLSRVHIQS